MTHTNLFIAFALSISLSTNICLNGQGAPQSSWLSKLMNVTSDSIINIMHKLTPKDALLLAGATGALGFFLYHINKAKQETQETKNTINAGIGNIIAERDRGERQIKIFKENLTKEGENMRMQYQTEEEIKKTMQHRIENQ